MIKHIVGFSGGIDSQAASRKIIEEFGPENVILTNSNAGWNEDPLTDAFIDEYSEKIHPVVRCNPIVGDMWETPGYIETYKTKPGKEWAADLTNDTPLTFDMMIKIKGRPPSRKAQFCTEILKLRPQRRFLRHLFGPGGKYEGFDYIRYTGVRHDESSVRMKYKDREWDNYFDCELVHPVLYWTKQQCFDYCKSFGEPINPLYMLGFNRVGCAPCINSSKADILNWLIRRPEMIEKIRRWEASTGRTYFAPRVPGKLTNSIDEVIEWSKTAHGGKQLLPIIYDKSGCESKYGLCE